MLGGVAVFAVLTVSFGSATGRRRHPVTAGRSRIAPTLNLTALGADPDISLYGLQGTQTVTVPVPNGLTPGALTADVELPPYVQGGTLIVTQGGRTLSRVELLQAESTPVSIPLTGARVVDDAVTFTAAQQAVARRRATACTTRRFRCSSPTPRSTYTGTEAPPTVVADFLPPVLQRMTIFIPRTPSPAESDAAVRADDSRGREYGRQNTDIDIACRWRDERRHLRLRWSATSSFARGRMPQSR